MKIANNIIAFISGADSRFLAVADTQSKNRYGIYAFYVLLYSAIYFFAGYGLMKMLFKVELPIAFTVGLIIGLFVFFFNRTMIIGESSIIIYVFRVILILAMNLIALMVIDSTIFHRDLALYEAEQEGDNVEEVIQNHPKALKLREEQEELQKNWHEYEVLMTEEISEKGGYGIRARQFEKKAVEFKKLATLKAAEYDELYQQLSLKAADANQGLLTKLKNMVNFTWRDNVARVIWMIFFTLIFVLEIMLLILKGQAKPGLYDMLVERDKLKRMYQLVRQ
jgi:hypothetical protein